VPIANPQRRLLGTRNRLVKVGGRDVVARHERVPVDPGLGGPLRTIGGMRRGQRRLAVERRRVRQ
jgi:hypothetical protein